MSGIQITGYSVSQATSSKALLLVTRRHPLNACKGTPYINHSVLGQKAIALDTHYDGGAINQSIPTYLQDVGRFRDFRSNWTLSRAADARSTSSDISSASYLQLYSSFLVLLEAEDPPLRSESTRTKWTCFRIRNNTATYIIINWKDCTAVHRPDACDEEIGLAISK